MSKTLVKGIIHQRDTLLHPCYLVSDVVSAHLTHPIFSETLFILYDLNNAWLDGVMCSIMKHYVAMFLLMTDIALFDMIFISYGFRISFAAEDWYMCHEKL